MSKLTLGYYYKFITLLYNAVCLNVGQPYQ